MTAVFADTFYWIAFTNIQDLAHDGVKAFTLASKPRLIVVTEEVLTEYLNYFAVCASGGVANCDANSGIFYVRSGPLSIAWTRVTA
jgi:hypothetical protein